MTMVTVTVAIHHEHTLTEAEREREREIIEHNSDMQTDYHSECQSNNKSHMRDSARQTFMCVCVCGCAFLHTFEVTGWLIVRAKNDMHCTLNRAAIGALKHQFIKEASQHQQLLQPCSNRRPARISHFVPRDSVRLCKKRTVLLMLFAACCSGMWWNFHRKRWKKAANINFMNHYLHLSFNHSHLAICFDTCLHACERSNLHCERSSFI